VPHPDGTRRGAGGAAAQPYRTLPPDWGRAGRAEDSTAVRQGRATSEAA
jgi:hypothetical protein